MPSEEYRTEPVSLMALWAGVLAGPLSALIMQETNFALVPWACAWGSEWPLYAVTTAAFAIAAAGSALSWRNWNAAGRERTGEAPGARERSRFMAAAGMLLCGFACLLIAAQGISNLFLNPCQP